MFRAQVLRRNFSLYNRLPQARLAQEAARHGHENITVHRFRVRRPFFSRSRKFGCLLFVAVFFGLRAYLGTRVRIVTEDERKLSKTIVAHAEGDDDEGDEYILFIPTGLSRFVPSKPYYKGSDPEWQEFKKVAADKARTDMIRRDLTNIVLSDIIRSGWERRFGKIDPSKGKQWLEIMFPDGPPADCVIPGLALTKELKWAWGTRSFDPDHHRHIQRLLKPTAVTTALCQDAKRRIGSGWQDLKVFFGWQQETLSKTLSLAVPSGGANRLPTPSPAGPSSGTTSNSSTTPAISTQQSAASSSPATEAGRTNILSAYFPDPKALTLDLTDLRRDLQRARITQRPPPLQMQRGCISVRGLIEFHGTRARGVVNVAGVYDPKENRFISTQINLYHYAEHRQVPKGGA